MKILINAVSARAGGGVSYLINLLKLLPEIAPEMHFLAAIPDIKLPEKFEPAENLEIVVIKEASGNIIKRYLWENSGLVRLCKDWQADLLFCVGNIIPILRPKIPVVVMIQNIAPLTPRVFKLLKRFEPIYKSLQMLLLKGLSLFAIKNADQVISLSEATARLVKKLSNGTNSEVLYHGIAKTFHPDAPRPIKSGQEPYFLYVSNLYVYKGLEYIVEALQSDPELPKVFVAGSKFDKGYLNWVNQEAAKAGVENRLIFLDNIPYNDLPGWYANSLAMVYTSWCENCPNILLESMSCGCPVVSMKIGPMPEICGKTGFYAEPFNGKSLADAMNRAWKNSGSRGLSAQQRAANFTWENSMQRHREIFHKILKTK